MSTDRFLGGVENIDGSFVAGSDLSGGDAVAISGDNEVDHVSSNGDEATGVVMYDVSEGDPVAVARVGAKARVNAASNAGPGLVAAQTDGTVDDLADDQKAIGELDEAESGGDAPLMVNPSGGEVSGA